MMGTMPRDV